MKESLYISYTTSLITSFKKPSLYSMAETRQCMRCGAITSRPYQISGLTKHANFGKYDGIIEADYLRDTANKLKYVCHTCIEKTCPGLVHPMSPNKRLLASEPPSSPRPTKKLALQDKITGLVKLVSLLDSVDSELAEKIVNDSISRSAKAIGEHFSG